MDSKEYPVITDDYRLYIKTNLEKKQSENKDMYSITKLAEAAHVQKTYMSRALKTEAHLNSDQIYLACHFLKMTKLERDFALALAEHNRSTSITRKKELETELKNLQRNVQKTKNQLKLDKASEVSQEYFSDPMHQIIHLGFTIPRFAQKSDDLRKCLGLSKDYFDKLCSLLERIGIITFKNSNVIVLKDRLHQDKEAPYFKSFTISSKLKTIEYFSRSTNTPRMDLSVAFSADEATREKIQQELMTALERIRLLVEQAPTQSVYQLNIDLFDWLV